MTQFKPLTLEEGKYLVKLARKSIEYYLEEGKLLPVPEDAPKRLTQLRYGAFVTLEIIPEERVVPEVRPQLRGCIGYITGVRNLVRDIIELAVYSATEDPRFPPVRRDELSRIIVEISILSKPELIEVKNPREYLDKVKIGEDGLMIEYGLYSGLLLPQVPVEYKWNVEQFLSELCIKAGLPPDMWLDRSVKIYKFKAQIFREKIPNGEVYERNLLEELRKHGKP